MARRQDELDVEVQLARLRDHAQNEGLFQDDPF
jgi:hypothetical protein